MENNKIEILFSNYVFGLTFQSPSLECKSEYIVRKWHFNFIILHENVLVSDNVVSH